MNITVSFFFTECSIAGRFWLGGTDIYSPGVLKWFSDGNLVSSGYTNWDDGQPEYTNDENGVSIYVTFMQWRSSYSCGFLFDYVCESY